MDRLFSDRIDAGKKLAKRLADHANTDTVLLAIPRGGVPITAAAAEYLRLPWHIIAVRKLPIPWNPEAGFGAIALDGTTVLNRAMVAGLRMRQDQINEVAARAVAELERVYTAVYQLRAALEIEGKTVIVVDDGLASGYTMLAAIESLRKKAPSRIIAAAPVASKTAADLVSEAADECRFDIVSASIPFAVANHYMRWHDLTDQELVDYFQAVRQPVE